MCHPQSPQGLLKGVIKTSGVYDKIVIVPPRQGACPICAVKHDKGSPHEPRSAYYRSRFRAKHHRYPDWEDAMAHCSEETKATLRKNLSEVI